MTYISEPLRVRASSLPTWSDCARRAATRMFRRTIAGAGFELRQTDQAVGGIIGSAVHAGNAYALTEKMNGDQASNGEANDRSIETLHEGMQSGVIYDDTTRNRNTAEKQVTKMVGSYRDHVIPKVEPTAVEQNLEITLQDGTILSGTCDMLCAAFGGLRDAKTGKVRRSPASQLGSYSLIWRSHGHDVKGLREDYIPRVNAKNSQPKPESYDYHLAACEHETLAVVADIKRCREEFERRYQLADPRLPPETAFLANPHSMLCSDKYCPAWGTNFCRVHKDAKEQKE